MRVSAVTQTFSCGECRDYQTVQHKLQQNCPQAAANVCADIFLRASGMFTNEYMCLL